MTTVPSSSSPPVVLAFSGGLDTSFCVPYLREKGHEVVTVFVDTGGADKAEIDYIEERARSLGAKAHVTADGSHEVWRQVVVPMVQGGALYQDCYPLLVSDRYVIVEKSLELCDKHQTKLFAHGCTGMGNDQVRFDQSVRSLGDYQILAPIRDIQKTHTAVRQYEAEFLEARGFAVRQKTGKYSINANVLGVTASGSEIDEYAAPDDATWTICAHPSQWPKERLRVRLTFSGGECTAVDGKTMPGPDILKVLNQTFGAYGVGRGIYTGDTTIGLKGRIVFECPGLTALMAAHKALEETILSREQNQFKATVAKKWVDLVYRGFFYEPLKADVETFLSSTQRCVNGDVVLETHGGAVYPVSVESPHILRKKGAVYAQSADWGSEEAEGFILLYGMSSTLSARINPLPRHKDPR